MSLKPGDEIHYIAFLDQNLNTLQVAPMKKHIDVPIDADPEWIRVDATVTTTIRGGT